MKKITFRDLEDKLEKRKSAQDIAAIKKAYEFAQAAHGDVVRLTGDPYFTHSLATAIFIASWNLDTTSVISSLLHDTISDGAATREDIVNEFGEDVAQIVDGVTLVSNLRLKGSGDEMFVESLRKMILVMAKDLRVVFVKLADRLNNMETLHVLPEVKQKKISRETMEIYAPLAERLGMGTVKAQLEDASFPFLHSDAYKKVIKESKPYYLNAKEHTERMKHVIEKKLLSEGLNAQVSGRQKHLYSLWRKLARPEIQGDYEKIHDIVALRLIMAEVSDCYAALGVVHSLYKPAPHLGISDFIAQPKPNGYRSIHTKVFGPEGRIVEVQIRSQQMHEQAEHGVAAHWAYADAKSHGAKDEKLEKEGVSIKGNKLSWVKELVEWQKEMSDTEEFARAVKFDALQYRNFVFSPKGDVYDLPSNATPVDFAFAVHTGLGNHIAGAKVNGKIVPLDYQLKSGDVVEILKSKNPRNPNKDWLRFVVTRSARKGVGKYNKHK